MNKIAVVTGGARGIGKAVCKELSQIGYTVIVNYNKSEKEAKTLCDEIRSQGYEAYSIQCSVENYESVEKMFSYIKKEYGYVNCLVNNAGISKDAYLMLISEADIKDIISVNLMGMINCCKAVIPQMISKKGGKIVNIASVAGVLGLVGQTAYSASKSASIGFTRSLASEVSGFNITVNSISPGYVDTDMLRNIDEKIAASYKEKIPLKRFAKPEEIAKAAAFLCSDSCSYITGQNIIIDGGLSIQ